MFPHSSYFAMRANEERRIAMASVDPRVRRVHLEMAARYAVAAGADVTLDSEDGLQEERRSA